jgi:hypothetical protein
VQEVLPALERVQDGYRRQDLLHQVNCPVAHAKPQTSRAEASTFARERYQLTVPAAAALKLQAAVSCGRLRA